MVNITEALSHLVELLEALRRAAGSRLVRRIGSRVLAPWFMSQSAAPYENLSYRTTLELKDSQGKVAILRRRQRVRFLQSNITALPEYTWGDGQQFAGFRNSLGSVVDRFRVGPRTATLISLRRAPTKGSVVSFSLTRRIEDAFTDNRGWLETQVIHPTKRLDLKVAFPPSRPPKTARVVEALSLHSLPVRRLARKMNRQLRPVVAWSRDQVRVGESYILEWEW